MLCRNMVSFLPLLQLCARKCSTILKNNSKALKFFLDAAYTDEALRKRLDLHTARGGSNYTGSASCCSAARFLGYSGEPRYANLGCRVVLAAD